MAALTPPPQLPKERAARDPWLAAQLAPSLPPVAFQGLPEYWRRTVGTFVCERPRGLEDGYWLAFAVRGAWGWALELDMQQPGFPGPADRVDPWAVFFGQHGFLTHRLALPHPFVFAVDASAREVTVRLTLFGIADYWRDQAFTALLIAFEQGIALRQGGSLRVAWRVLDWWWTREERLAIPAPPSEIRLRFLTPFSPRNGRIRMSIPDLLFGLGDRLSGLARWQGFAVKADWSAIRTACNDVLDTIDRVVPTALDLGGNRKRSLTAFAGAIELRRVADTLWPLVVLGTTCHVGARTTYGLGRYELL